MVNGHGHGLRPALTLTLRHHNDLGTETSAETEIENGLQQKKLSCRPLSKLFELYRFGRHGVIADI